MPETVHNTPIENRYVTVEDWLGNRYLFNGSGASSGNGGGSGYLIDPFDITQDKNKKNSTDGGVITDDNEANHGKCLGQTSDSAADKFMATMFIDNIPFGDLAVSMRIKPMFGTIGTNTPIAELQCLYHDNTSNNEFGIAKMVLTPSAVGDRSGKWATIGTIVPFRGIYTSSYSLKLRLVLLHYHPHEAHSLFLDSVWVNRAFTSITSTHTIYDAY